MERLQQLMRGMPGGNLAGAGGGDSPSPDCAEKVHVSSLALLKMLKHGRAGVPMEVMGLMLGEFVDDYTINCVDVFAMPQSGTSVSVEAVDPVFQTKMLDMLKHCKYLIDEEGNLTHFFEASVSPMSKEILNNL